jgi:hypothetical protein
MAFDARRWRSPHTITALATVADADVPALRTELARREQELRPGELPMVHFLRLFVVDADHDLRGRPLAARLVVSIVFDGTAENVLAAWVDLAGDALVALLGRCVDGPSRPEDVAPFVLARAVRPNTFHIGTVGSTVAQIREELALAVELRRFIDEHYASPGQGVTAEEIRRRALEYVKGRPGLPQQPRPPQPLLAHVLKQADLVRTVAAVLSLPLAMALAYSLYSRGGRRAFGLSLAVSSAAVFGFAAGTVRFLELTEPDVVVRQDDAKVKALEEAEDLTPQNQFTMVAPVRDSAARRLILRGTLFLSDEFSKHFSSSGRLVGVETIHFARIHQIDQGRRFLFMSDFDGGWNRYLFDFLTTGAFAVVPNWTNLLGCPKTKFLLEPGPGFAQRFLPFTRAEQLRSDVWYSAFPDLTVLDILKNEKIRQGLFSTDRADAERWVRLL